MAESDDPKIVMSKGGSALTAVKAHFMEGDTADGSTGIEFAVPAGAVTVEIYSDVDAFCGPETEVALDIAGSDMNAFPIKADVPSLQFSVVDATAFSVKARTGNLGLVVARWGGDGAP